MPRQPPSEQHLAALTRYVTAYLAHHRAAEAAAEERRYGAEYQAHIENHFQQSQVDEHKRETEASLQDLIELGDNILEFHDYSFPTSPTPSLASISQVLTTATIVVQAPTATNIQHIFGRISAGRQVPAPIRVVIQVTRQQRYLAAESVAQAPPPSTIVVEAPLPARSHRIGRHKRSCKFTNKQRRS